MRLRLRRPRATDALPAPAPGCAARLSRAARSGRCTAPPCARTQSHDGDPAAPAVPGRLEPRARLADRVPGRGLGRGRLHRQLHGTIVRALSMKRRLGASGGRHAAREDGRVAGGRRRRAGRARDGRARPGARPPQRPAALGEHVGSPIESSPVVATDRLLRRVERQRLRARPAHAPLPLGLPLGLQDHVERRAGRPTLYIGDYGGRLLALAPGSGRLRWSAGGQRPDLRDAGSLGREGLRAVLGRRLADRVLERAAATSGGSTPAATSTRRRPSGAGTSTSARTTAACTRVSARTGAVRWAVQTGGPISGAPAVVDGVVYAGSFAHRILGVDARSGRVLLDFPHGEYVPVSGSGDRLLLHGYSRLYAVEATSSGRRVRMTAGLRHRAAGTARARSSTASG